MSCDTFETTYLRGAGPVCKYSPSAQFKVEDIELHLDSSQETDTWSTSVKALAPVKVPPEDLFGCKVAKTHLENEELRVSGEAEGNCAGRGPQEARNRVSENGVGGVEGA